MIERLRPEHIDAWATMRHALWPDADLEDLRAECQTLASSPDLGVFTALDEGAPIGFAEVGLRVYAEGCTSSPVGYLEGWWVHPEWRHRGLGRALVEAAAAWCQRRGLAELASDTWLENPDAIRAHRALGFEETERVVCFRRALPPTPDPLGVSEGYDRWAASYDADANPTRDLAHALLTQRCPADTRLLVELGCGTGALLARLPFERAVGVDASPGMLERARARLSDRPVTLHEASITAPLPIAEGAADVIVLSLVLEHLPDLTPVFRGAREVLTTGGLLLVAEYHPRRLARGGARFSREGRVHTITSHPHTFADLAAPASLGFTLTALEEPRAPGDAEPRLALFTWRAS